MRCPKIKKVLLEHVESALPLSLQPVVEAHLQTCSTCREHAQFLQTTVGALKQLPQQAVPDSIWEAVARETSSLPIGAAGERSRPGIAEALGEILKNLSWGAKLAFSSAFTMALVILGFWGTIGTHRVAAMQVVEVAGNPVSSFPAYFREHHNPSGQPIADGDMILAFNTAGENH